MPHLEKVHYSISRTMPEVSRATPAKGTKLVSVWFFRIENGVVF